MSGHEYFPGGNTPFGFFSYYNYILEAKNANRRIMLKGGPGTGKSTLMKTVADKLSAHDFNVALLHCSSDPDSLDAIVVDELGFCMLDGTAPHIVDPSYPGATDEIINLGNYWDNEKIQEKQKQIFALSKQISDKFSDAYDYLAAAKHIQNHQRKHALRHVDTNALHQHLNALIADLNLQPHVLTHGKIKKGFLSAITPKGMVNFIDSFTEGTSKTVRIKSNFDSSSMFMNPLANLLIQNGFSVELYYCPVQPESKIEHIFLPEENLFFTTENAYHQANSMYAQIDLDAHIQADLQTHTDHECVQLLFSNAIRCIQNAKSLHDELEAYYIPHMDFSCISTLADHIVNSLV